MKIPFERNRGKTFSLLTALIIVTSLCFGIVSFASDHSASRRMWEVPIVAPMNICTFQDGHQCALHIFPSELPFKPSANLQAPSNFTPVTRNENQLFLDETEFRLPVLIDFSTDIELGDVDGDDDLDMFVANTDGQQNRLYINDGSGIFNDETKDRLPEDDDFSLGVEFGDVDQDGDLDIFIANNFAFQVPDCTILSGQNRLMINDGTGVFHDETKLRLPQSIAASTDAICVDVDGDDDLDIIVVNSIRPDNCFFVAGGQVTLLINDGSGFFVDETEVRMPLAFYSDVGVDVGDVDGDSDFDIVVANPYGHNRILVNDGSGMFTDQSNKRLSHSENSTRGVILFDADNDDDLDIFWASDSTSVWPGQNGSQNFLLINDGAGIFEDETDVRLPMVQDVSMGGADFGDVDGDGDLDVIVANNKFMSEGRQNHLLINTGSGYYAEEVATYLPAINDVSAEVKLGDVNGDGVLDVVVANYGEQNHLFIGKSEPRGGPGEPEVLRGDVDSDGEINVTDVLTLVNHIMGHVPLDEESLYRADCNDDGQVDILDATGIVNVILGIGECSPGGCKAEITPEVLEFFKELGQYLSEEDFRRFLAIVQRKGNIPIEYRLSQNYPNPFNPETRIDFQIASAEMVNVAVFNALGQSVRTLINSEHEAGLYTLQWDGCNDSGQRVPSGVYLYQLKAGNYSITKKMILMK